MGGAVLAGAGLMAWVCPQDLLSFELLDINIVQELETVPNNTPVGELRPRDRSSATALGVLLPAVSPVLLSPVVDLTPCMSPLPQDAPATERAAATAELQGAELKGCFSK